MGTSPDFLAFLEEQLAPLGPVAARRMFGGAGLFLDGLMFALVADDALYFKADDLNRADFEAEGMEAFSYARKEGGPRTVMSYWRAPERLLDETDDLVVFAGRALVAARRSAAKVKPQPPRRPRARRKGA